MKVCALCHTVSSTELGCQPSSVFFIGVHRSSVRKSLPSPRLTHLPAGGSRLRGRTIPPQPVRLWLGWMRWGTELVTQRKSEQRRWRGGGGTSRRTPAPPQLQACQCTHLSPEGERRGRERRFLFKGTRNLKTWFLP